MGSTLLMDKRGPLYHWRGLAVNAELLVIDVGRQEMSSNLALPANGSIIQFQIGHL